MIATILPSSPTFHAVAYNEIKVSKGMAALLEMSNFGEIGTFGYSALEDLQQFLIEYSSRNSRIKQPQFHLAISCKGHEFTEEQLVEFAHRYLKEMGYGDPGQPLLIYAHRDTDNTHLHVITSRIDPNGKKINDSNERRRSQKVIDKLMQTDLKSSAEKDVKVAMQFDFRNLNQFKAVMEAMNYECFEKDGMMNIKKGGMIQTKVKVSDIIQKAEENKTNYYQEPSEKAKWRSIFQKYRDTNSNRSGLERDLKKMFGMSLVFFGKKDSPYGYMAIDFNRKRIYEGSQLLSINDLLDFRTPEEHMEDIEDLINNTFEQNAFITTKGINKKLKKMGAYIRKDAVIFGNIRKPLADSHRAILERNNKVEWRNGFKVQTKEERDLLCRLTGFDYPDLLTLHTASNGKYYSKNYRELSDIFSITDSRTKYEAFTTSGFKIVTDESGVYAYRPETQSLTNLSSAGFDKTLYEPLLPTEHPKAAYHKKDASHSSRTFRPNQDGSHYANREWEVGKKGKDRDDMDQPTGVTY